jgi:N-acetylglucosamine-6-phosphate deacetylase
VELFLRAKGEERAVLITDAISATGMPDGTYRLGGMDVEVQAGKCIHNGKLAGSVLTLDRAVRNVMDFAGWTLQQAVRLATANPARVLGVAAGRLQPGARADLAVLSPAGEVIRTVVGGR